MRELCSFDYAIVRVVPRVDRGEFINAGVILFCPTQGYLESRIELDRSRHAGLLVTGVTFDLSPQRLLKSTVYGLD